MDKRLLILIAVFVLGSAGFLAYRKFVYKPEGIRYTIKPLGTISIGDSIAYDDQTASASRWKWDFGDGEFSADQTGHHTYLAAGKFPVTLTVYGAFGVQQKSDVVNVLAHDIVAKVNGPTIIGPAEAKTGVPASWQSGVSAKTYDWKVEGEAHLPGQAGLAATYAFKSAGRHTLVLTTHNPDNIIRKDINVVADQPTSKPAPATAAIQMPPQQHAAHVDKPKPPHHETPKKGNALEDLGDGEVIKK